MTDTADADKQAQQNTTTATSSSGKDGQSAVSTDTKADAELSKKLADLQRQNTELQAAIEESKKAEEKRKQKKLEEEGKYKELVDEKEKALTTMEGKYAALERQSKLLEAVTASDTPISKAALLRMAKLIEFETSSTLDIPDVVTKAIEDLGKIAPSNGAGETKAFGATGAAMGVKGTQAEAMQNLAELGIRAKFGGPNDRARYTTARQEYTAQHGAIPQAVTQKIAAALKPN